MLFPADCLLLTMGQKEGLINGTASTLRGFGCEPRTCCPVGSYGRSHRFLLLRDPSGGVVILSIISPKQNVHLSVEKALRQRPRPVDCALPSASHVISMWHMVVLFVLNKDL